MSRNRMIKAEFWEDAKVGKLSLGARLLFIGLWNMADDVGNAILEPVFLKSRLFGHDEDVDKGKVTEWLSELVTLGLVIRYEVNSESYGSIRNFLKHQYIDKPSKWKNPSPPTTPGVLSSETKTKDETKVKFNFKPQLRRGWGHVERAIARENNEFKLCLMDALAKGIGGAPASNTEKRLWEGAADELVEIGASPAEVVTICRAWPNVWPDARITPKALLKHWSLLKREVAEVRRT